MPYNRTKGRTLEIPPSPSSRQGRSRSASSVTDAVSPFDLRQVDAHLEAQLEARLGSRSQKRNDWRSWLVWVLMLPLEVLMMLIFRPLAAFGTSLVELYRETPAVVPAVGAMLFLYVGLPLLIAWDIV